MILRRHIPSPRRLAALFLAVASLAIGARAAEPRFQASWASLDQRACPQWYLDAKFGLFIHWGIYSVPAWAPNGEYAEWYWHHISDRKPDNPWWLFHKATYGADFTYPQFAPQFTCELFNPAQWADLFVRSGARYIVPTSKHHDGFCLWPSADATRTWGRTWNSAVIGPKRDLIGELADATRARGIKFGFYYSLYEWYNPLWLSNRPRYVAEHLFPQFKDAVTRYKPAIIFSDGEWDQNSKQWRSEELLAWLFNDSPCRDEVVVDDRWGKDTVQVHGTYYTTEYAAGMPSAGHPWEENRGMGHSYGLNRIEGPDDYRTSRELVLTLVDTVSRGGNLLLDIGPAADGTIPVIMQQRLIDIGNWLKFNGEAIYGTRSAGRSCQWSAGPLPRQVYGKYRIKYNLLDQVGQEPRDGHAVKQAFFTAKPDALYATTPGWPGKELVLRGVRVPAGTAITLLGHEGPVSYSVSGDTLTIRTPDLGPESLPFAWAYTFKITGGKLAPL